MTAASRVAEADPAGLARALAPLLADPVRVVRAEAAARLAGPPARHLSEAQRRAWESALAEYEAGQRYMADMPSGPYNLGNLYAALGRTADAEKQYRRALAIDDQLFLARANLAMLLAVNGRGEEAERLLREAHAQQPGHAGIAFNLGLLLAERGDPSGAERMLRIALGADPRMAAAAFNLAVLVGERKPAEAVGLARKALSLRPGDARYAWTLGYYQSRAGDLPGAAATLESLLATHPEEADARRLLADVYERQGRNAEAARLRGALPAPLTRPDTLPGMDLADLRAQWESWKAERLARLTAERGWLSVTGLHWLEPGPNHLPALPGTFTLRDRQVELEAGPGDGYAIGGDAVERRVLVSDASGTPDLLALGSGRWVAVLARGDRFALRTWDAAAPRRRTFPGIETYPFDPAWRVRARWEAWPAPRAVEVEDVTGSVATRLVPGRALFTWGGRELSLEPGADGDRLAFVFRDATAGVETYGAGRFLSAEAPADGAVLLDFNRAFNPPCAFTPFATCPLPRPENVLPVRVTAGERFDGDH